MLENPTNLATYRAMQSAHEERAKAMKAVWSWLLGKH